MSVTVLIGAGLVGGLGAMARFLVDGAVAERLGRDFPFGTLVVNLSGAFALGALVGLAPAADVYTLAGGGFVGAYTTFSTWALESHRLEEDGRRWHGALNFGVSLALGLAVAWAGRMVGRAL